MERPAPSNIIVPQGKFFERSFQLTIGLYVQFSRNTNKKRLEKTKL
jgi:hypothetical protein